jgi:hypothetical protein
MPLLGPQQRQFVGTLSRETGLNPRVVGAWALAEQSGGAARSYEQARNNNFLNIAMTDQGPARGAYSSAFRNPQSAAKATAEWLKGGGQITREYGKAAPGILQILRAGGNPQAQINAIARSGWASSGYNGGNDLRQLFGQLAGENIPVPSGPTGAPISGEGASYLPGPLRLGIQQGQGNPAIVAAITSLLSQSEGPPRSVAAEASIAKPEGLTPQLAMPAGARGMPSLTPKPEPSLAQKLAPLLAQLGAGESESHVISEGRGPGTLVSGAGNALTNAVPRGTKLRGFLPGNAALTVKRIDQGQDIQTTPGGAILAPGSGYVTNVPSNPGGFGISYPVVHFTSGPLAGHDVYIGHTRAALPQGAHFAAGAVLSHTGTGTGPYVGNATGLPGWAEIGLWPPGSMSAGRQIAPLLGLRG